MNRSSWIAVAVADFKITTYRLRGKRKEYFLILLFLLLTFGYLVRVIVSFALRDVPIIIQPPEQAYPIILLLLFFGFFTPLVSPLGQLASSESSSVISEPALASPASREAFFLGRLFSNLAFFSPLYTLGMVAGLTFIPTNPFRNPNVAFVGLTIASFLLSVLALSLGATIAYLIELSFISSTSRFTRPLVSIIMGLSLLFAIPLTDWILKHSFEELPKLFILVPFIAASKIVIWALYSGSSTDTFYSIASLVSEIVLIWILGGVIAAKKMHGQPATRPNNFPTKKNKSITYRSGLSEILNAYWKISVRNPEFWTKAVLGLSVMTFTLSLFSRPQIFSQDVEITPLAKALVAVFALSFSGLSLLYISTSGILIEKKDFLSIVLIAPHGNLRTSLGKLFFSFGIVSIFYVPFMTTMVFLNAIPMNYFFSIYFYIMAILFSEALLMLGIFSINVVHEEEDLMNLVNLVILFILVSFPTTYVISIAIETNSLSLSSLFLSSLVFLAFAALIWTVGVISRSMLDLGTSNSIISFFLKKGGSSLIITVFVWMLLPFPLVSLGIIMSSEYLIIGSAHIMGLLFLLYIGRHNFSWFRVKQFYLFRLREIVLSLGILLILYLQSAMILFIVSRYFGGVSVGIVRGTLSDFHPLIAVLLVLFLGFVEEFYFREYLYKLLEGHRYPIFYVLVSSFLFSSLHLVNLISIINAFLAGIILGYLRIKSFSFNTAFFVHVAFNLGIILFLS